MAKPALGRGLGALLGGAPAAAKPPLPAASPAAAATVPAPEIDVHDRVQHVSLGRIRPCPFQPRKDFTPDALRELADSIREQGIVQPLIVRDRGDHFELIAGERRWRAAQLLNLPEVPIILREADDRAVLELALIENLQRENLNAIEEAMGYSQLISQFQLTQEDVATKVGKSRAVVTNALRLLKLPQALQSYIRDGRLSVGHAKVVLGLATEKQQQHAAERVIKEGLNVRQTEGLIAKLQARSADPTKPAPITPLTKDAHVANLENRIRERLGTKVQLRYSQGKGSLDISFFSDDELERILQILGITPD
ncbi:MAG TPA: ParB/RepB/Spo0J family partition protein [Verrucomicrobiae bacterium]|jgi:ParB family chromosome partitioning protein|nr:ParB/RepB/Spo0J family partition protein [Verrucomicrobiae bacterium]